MRVLVWLLGCFIQIHYFRLKSGDIKLFTNCRYLSFSCLFNFVKTGTLMRFIYITNIEALSASPFIHISPTLIIYRTMGTLLLKTIIQ